MPAPLTLSPLADEPLVTITMAAHNAERFIGEAVSSLLGQTYRRFTLTIIDDGSADGTAKVLRQFSDPRITVITHATNCGGYQTMNEGIARATGDPVAVFHADDVYGTTIVEREVDLLRRHPEIGAVFTQNHMMRADGVRKGTNHLPPELHGREILDYDTVFRHFLRYKNTLICCPTFMARRATLAAVGPFDAERYHVAADVDLWIRILQRCPVGMIDEPLMSYRHSDAQWSQRYKRLRTDPEVYFEILDRYLSEDPALAERRQPDLVHHAFHRVDDETFRAVNAIILGDPKLAGDLLRRHRFPWTSLLQAPTRRKVRTALLRVLLRVSLTTHSTGWLAPVLKRTEH